MTAHGESTETFRLAYHARTYADVVNSSGGVAEYLGLMETEEGRRTMKSNEVLTPGIELDARIALALGCYETADRHIKFSSDEGDALRALMTVGDIFKIEAYRCHPPTFYVCVRKSGQIIGSSNSTNICLAICRTILKAKEGDE